MFTGGLFLDSLLYILYSSSSSSVIMGEGRASSNLFLKLFTDVAVITSLGRLFHMLTTLIQNEYFRTS